MLTVAFSFYLSSLPPWLEMIRLRLCRVVSLPLLLLSNSFKLVRQSLTTPSSPYLLYLNSEITEQRLGCYLPVEHIDNPKGYGEGADPRQYYPGLRPPIDPRELQIDPRTGMKNYIVRFLSLFPPLYLSLRVGVLC